MSDSIPQKRCNVCKEYYPRTEDYFNKRRASIDGLAHRCRECDKMKGRERAKIHSIEAIARSKAWYEDHKEYAKEWFANYYQENKPKKRQQAKEWREKNRDYDREQHRLWVLAHPERRREIANDYGRSEKGRLARIRRRARERNLPDTFTANQWAYALIYFNEKCCVCGSDKIIHADHWIPLVSPICPGTIASNIVPLCQHCNSSKSKRMPEEWLKRKYPEMVSDVLMRVQEYFESIVD